MAYYAHIVVMIEIMVLSVLGYHISFGLARAMNLAHAVLVAIAAYAFGLASTQYSLSFGISVIASILMSGVLALLLTIIAGRLSGDFFALASLALAGIVQAFLINWTSVTRGVLGIPGIIPLPIIPWVKGSPWEIAISLLIIVLPAILLVHQIDRGRYGRLIRAYGQSPEVASALGISGRWVNAASLGGGAFFAALSGAVYASYISYIDPSFASLTELITVLAIVVLGRPGSLYGCIAATIGLTLLPEILRFFPLPSSSLGHLRMLMYATALVVSLLFRRSELQRGARAL